MAAKMLLWDKKTLNFGRAIGSFRFGLFRRRLIDSSNITNTLYACGGGFAVDKTKFLRLGGFDEDMIAYWEDADLCYRGWKRGWKTVYEPRSIIYHKFHGSYLKKCGESGIREISGKKAKNKYAPFDILLPQVIIFNKRQTIKSSKICSIMLQVKQKFL